MTTYGNIETIVRRDIVNDNDSTIYRWEPFAVLSSINRAVCDIAETHNPNAAYDPITGARKNVDCEAISTQCDADPWNIKTQSTYTIGSQVFDSVENFINAVRSLEIPIADKFRYAIAYIAASKLYETDNEDKGNQARAMQLLLMGIEYARTGNLKSVAHGSEPEGSAVNGG